MQQNSRIAVAGATGRVGRHVVDILESRGYGVVPISRSHGVDVITGEGLDEALAGVRTIIDVATGPSPDQRAATDFFMASTGNLQEAGDRAGVRRVVLASIIGIDAFEGGYNAAKRAQEKAHLEGPIPARIVRAAQFHEFVEELMRWGTQGDVSYVFAMRTQLVAARTVAEELVGARHGLGRRLRRGRDHGDRRPARGAPRGGGPHAGRASWRRPACRGDEATLRPGQRPLRERRRTAAAGRQARRPDIRGVARRDHAGRARIGTHRRSRP